MGFNSGFKGLTMPENSVQKIQHTTNTE